MRSSLLAGAFLIATVVAFAAPTNADAQIIIRGPRVGVAVGTPYNNGYYNNGYYGGYRPNYNSYYGNNRGIYNSYYGNYRPAYNSYYNARPYGYSQPYYGGNSFYGVRRNWR